MPVLILVYSSDISSSPLWAAAMAMNLQQRKDVRLLQASWSFVRRYVSKGIPDVFRYSRLFFRVSWALLREPQKPIDCCVEGRNLAQRKKNICSHVVLSCTVANLPQEGFYQFWRGKASDTALSPSMRLVFLSAYLQLQSRSLMLSTPEFMNRFLSLQALLTKRKFTMLEMGIWRLKDVLTKTKACNPY